MSPTGMKEKFEIYRTWFKALMMKEFINLPAKYQDRFIAIVDRFLKDCKRLRKESEEIKEKDVEITVDAWHRGKDELTGHGTAKGATIVGSGSGNKIMINLPLSWDTNRNVVNWTVYSLDGETWYSSKTELITGGTK